MNMGRVCLKGLRSAISQYVFVANNGSYVLIKLASPIREKRVCYFITFSVYRHTGDDTICRKPL